MKPLKNLARTIKTLIFPQSCIICNKIINDGNFCAEDWNKLEFLTKQSCKICFQPFYHQVENSLCPNCLKQKPSYNQLISVLKYNDQAAKLIAKFKYYDQIHLSKIFANLMFKNAQEILKEINIIAPVPLHKKRILNRRYNQSALLAQEISKLSKKPTIQDLLLRTKHIPAQAALTKKQRQKNIKGAFKLNPKYQEKIHQKNILLIDDVITTGSTIEECSQTLLKFKPNKIYILTLAKTILD